MISERLKNLSESATLAMSRLSRELASEGHDVISLSLGEPDFDTPEFIKDAAKEAIDNNFSHYTPVPGLLELREAIVKKFKRDNGLNYTPEQIVTSTGAKQSIANICLSILNPGDEVLLLAPYWVSYYEIVKLAEAKPVIIPSSIDNDFKTSPSDIRNAVTDKTRMIIFSSPCNPSGTVYTKDDLYAISKVLEDHPNIFIVSDEIYEHINFTNNHFSIGTISSIKDRTITVNGVSKGFAMTGWRVGFIGAPLWIAKACAKIQGQVTSATCSIAQKATESAMLKEPKKITKNMSDKFLHRRDLVLKKLDEIPGLKSNIPQGAFYIFPDISYYFGKSHNGEVIKNANDLCMYLLNNAHVALVSGSAFGQDECIRISYAASEEKLIEACKRIKKQLSLLS
ncbi:MAG: pyridoxal phosphate-dependent aminotransferase [Bacteroidota bacterium]|nr:pyridoxal phosphate-dependent aminotransferase [Bacteroidota bacterium]